MRDCDHQATVQNTVGAVWVAGNRHAFYDDCVSNDRITEEGNDHTMGYVSLPDGMDFSTEFDTFIIAFCPDGCEWFVTNKRFFYFEYDKEFATENEAIEYFRAHFNEFYEIEMRICEYRPSFASGKVWLSNTDEVFDCRKEADEDA